jgi:hypothetical protein
LVAILPWTVRGELSADDRHQRRQQAAEILRNAIGGSGDPATTGGVEACRSAVSRAIQLIGPDRLAAQELTRALREADGSNVPADAAFQVLSRRIDAICESLAFAPIMEAEMPTGFPAPTPVDEVEVKQYPAYRMAQTSTDGNGAFWTLFNHIKRNDIAMTAPVEMSHESNDSAEPAERSMAFLYGNRSLGKTGSDGSVRVVDVPPQTVISTGVRGDRTREKILSAQRRLREWMDSNSTRYQPAGELRVMGYNSPFVPSKRRYFEVQIPVRSSS